MKIIIFTLLACLFTVAQAANQPVKRSYLLVITAKNGAILKGPALHSKLILTNLHQHALWFTDRPFRKAGVMPLKDFVANWQAYFKDDSPNAALAHADLMDSQGGTQPVVLELEKPFYHHGQLTFSIKSLSGQLKDRKLTDVDLFIDGFPANPARLTPYPNFHFKVG